MANVSFQKSVNRNIAPGQPGDKAGHGMEVVRAYLAVTNVIPGTFVIATDTLNATPTPTSYNVPKKAGSSTGAATGVVAGLVTRDSTGVINDLTNAYQDYINAGLNIQVASQGEYMIHLDEIAAGTTKIGQQITIADKTTGVPSLVANGTAGAEHWWLVEVLDAASGLGIISSWRGVFSRKSRRT